MIDFDKSATYYKIIGANNYSNNGHYQYGLGLNTLADNNELFNKEPICGPGGLYFCSIEYIFVYLDYGNKVCILTIPDDAQVVKVNNKYKADQIYIEEMMEINNDTTEAIKYLIQCGADTSRGYEYLINWAARKGNLEIVKYVIEHGIDGTVNNNFAIQYASEHGYLEIVEYLVKNGASVTAWNNSAIRSASTIEIARYLAKHGADMNVAQPKHFRILRREVILPQQKISGYFD